MTKRDSPFSSFRIQIAHSYKEGLPIRCFVRMRNLGMAPCRPAPLRKAV